MKFKALVCAGFVLSSIARAAVVESPTLWQERYFFDSLLAARSRQERTESDPQLLPVMRAVAAQIAQQAANLKRVDAYVAAQKGNVRFAFAQKNSDPSLQILIGNFQTLARGSGQIRNNLDYLAVRCRLASSQALSDPDMEKASLIILGQIRIFQMNLNALYENAEAVLQEIDAAARPKDWYLKRSAEMLVNNLRRLQNSVFSVYNSAHDLALRCR